MMRVGLGRALGALVAVAVLTMPATAWAQTGMLKGKVVDAEGKPVDGAKITIEAQGVKSVREVKTNKKGEWIQIGLFPGMYVITAEKGNLKFSQETRVSIGENPELLHELKASGPSPEQKQRQAALQKAFDDGVALSRQGKFDESIAKFNEAIATAPNCHDCYYNIGYAYSQQKEWEKAEGAFKKATEIKPDYAEAWNGLANVYNQQKKLDEALAATAKASQLGGGGTAGGGGNASGLYNQGVILWNQNKYAEAKEKFDAAAKADPSYADAHYRLGMANVNLGDMPGAVAAFENYLKAAPDGPHAAEVKGFIAAMKK